MLNDEKIIFTAQPSNLPASSSAPPTARTFIQQQMNISTTIAPQLEVSILLNMQHQQQQQQQIQQVCQNMYIQEPQPTPNPSAFLPPEVPPEYAVFHPASLMLNTIRSMTIPNISKQSALMQQFLGSYANMTAGAHFLKLQPNWNPPSQQFEHPQHAEQLPQQPYLQMPCLSLSGLPMAVYKTQAASQALPLLTHQNIPALETTESVVISSSLENNQKESMSLLTQEPQLTTRTLPVECDGSVPSPQEENKLAKCVVSQSFSPDILENIEEMLEVIEQQCEENNSKISALSTHGNGKEQIHEVKPSPASDPLKSDNEGRKRSNAFGGDGGDDSQKMSKPKKQKKEEPMKKGKENTKSEASVVEEELVVTTIPKRDISKRDKLEEVEEEEEDCSDLKNVCGLGHGCKLPAALTKVEWVQCEDCLQWWHNWCKFGNNDAYQEQTFSCCKIMKKSKSRAKKHGRRSSVSR